MRTITAFRSLFAGAALAAAALPAAAQTPLGTSFTYQGLLQNAGVAVTTAQDFQFSLWTAGTGVAVLARPVGPERHVGSLICRRPRRHRNHLAAGGHRPPGGSERRWLLRWQGHRAELCQRRWVPAVDPLAP